MVSTDLQAQSPAYKDEAFTQYFRQVEGWIASDATISVPLPNNRSLWLFGDTHLDDYRASDNSMPCLFQVNNSMLVQDMEQPTDFTLILDRTRIGKQRTPVKDLSNESLYFWPGHGYSQGDTTYVFWLAYTGFEMAHAGTYLAKMDNRDPRDASAIKELVRLPLPAGVEWGNAVLTDTDTGYRYLYGQVKDWIIHRPLLARVPLDGDITGPWEFFDGTGWVADAAAAQQLMASEDDYVSPSFSVFKLQDKYFMISQDIGFLTCGYGREIYAWESSSPEGPFTNKKLVYTIEDQYRGEYWVTYNATAHPQFIRNNELLISYNVNGLANNGVQGVSCQNECQDAFRDRRNADGYRPKFIRLPLTYLDPALQIPDRYFPAEPTGLLQGYTSFEKLEVYPNPAAGRQVQVTIGDAQPGGPLQLRVYDLQGRLVLEQQQQGTGTTSLRLPASGLYLLQVRSPGKRGVARILIP
ncbi:DUF5005 domain-containing protein [Cesiribacter andamanensis]|uniref:DUF5005 domain-containing protein n=1 Tax=Cesiribacter andamanensis TaxID=649507 RepID=UPI00137867F6|nr:DUF5005 domain-containing protein [Cesiribacter andamanensis]